MHQDWEDSWGGHLELWKASLSGMEQHSKSISPAFNKAVLFQTSDISWHGMPEPVNCPVGRARKSIAIYYVSDPRPDANPRLKAMFLPRPGSEAQKGYLQLCWLRAHRRLACEDMLEHSPFWKARWST
jgi:hypothetical protein